MAASARAPVSNSAPTTDIAPSDLAQVFAQPAKMPPLDYKLINHRPETPYAVFREPKNGRAGTLGFVGVTATTGPQLINAAAARARSGAGSRRPPPRRGRRPRARAPRSARRRRRAKNPPARSTRI